MIHQILSIFYPERTKYFYYYSDLNSIFTPVLLSSSRKTTGYSWIWPTSEKWKYSMLIARKGLINHEIWGWLSSCGAMKSCPISCSGWKSSKQNLSQPNPRVSQAWLHQTQCWAWWWHEWGDESWPDATRSLMASSDGFMKYIISPSHFLICGKTQPVFYSFMISW